MTDSRLKFKSQAHESVWRENPGAGKSTFKTMWVEHSHHFCWFHFKWCLTHFPGEHMSLCASHRKDAHGAFSQHLLNWLEFHCLLPLILPCAMDSLFPSMLQERKAHWRDGNFVLAACIWWSEKMTLKGLWVQSFPVMAAFHQTIEATFVHPGMTDDLVIHKLT